MLCLLNVEDQIPREHPLRSIKGLADEALKRLSSSLGRMYAKSGRPSVPPERLLKGMLLIALYSIRSEVQFCEQLRYNLLFRWFLDMDMTEVPFDHCAFSDNRDRLMKHDAAGEFFRQVVKRAEVAGLMSPKHFMENRNGLLKDIRLTKSTGTAEREAALDMLRGTGPRAGTLGADAAYDAKDFVRRCRERGVTPHVARKRHSAIDGRTVRHSGYRVSQVVRRRAEQIFGWLKTVGGLRKTRYKGRAKNQLAVYMAGAAYNLLRMAKLMPTSA